MAALEAYQLSAGEAARAIGDGLITPSALIEACLERVATREAMIQAWTHLAAEEARMAARLRDAQQTGGALYGIPFGVKDIIEAAGLPMSCGSPIYQGHVARRDAAPVALLQEAGGVCLGKTVTTELAHFHPGKTRNPHRPTHTPGGSSSGSAAVVAAGMAPIALGTQTTGSVLRPASFCGVYGFKPSFGDVSRSGVMDCATSFDTVGWFTRSVEDVETVRQALLRVPHRPLEQVTLGDLRIGFFKGPNWEEAAAETRDLVAGAAERLARAGARIKDIVSPAYFADFARHHRTVSGFEFARAITWERVEHRGKLSPRLVDGRCQDGLQCTYEHYVAAQEALLEARSQFEGLMTEFDVLLTPVAAGCAPEGLLATGDPLFNTAWTALGVPALSVPAFRDRTGLPVGLQIVAAYRRDHKMLAAAQAIAAEFDVAVVRPVD